MFGEAGDCEVNREEGYFGGSLVKAYTAAIGIVIVLLFSSCSGRTPPNRNCPLASLMPDTSVFPTLTKHPIFQSPAPKLAYGSRSVDSGFQEYQFGTATSVFDRHRATNEVQRWSTISVAKCDYIDRRDLALKTGDRHGADRFQPPRFETPRVHCCWHRICLDLHR